jgi:hypothetical protein
VGRIRKETRSARGFALKRARYEIDRLKRHDVDSRLDAETFRQTFTVHMSNGHAIWDISARLFVDGKYIHSYSLRRSSSGVVAGVNIGPGQQRPFVFSEITTTGMSSCQAILEL